MKTPLMPLARALGLAVLAVAFAGCGKGGWGKYVPPEQDARKALEAALTAWQNGQAADSVTVSRAKVEVQDSVWKNGGQLAGYEIVQEEPAGTGPRWFSVKLTMKAPAGGEKVVRYAVLGKNPLWVYREEDYNRLNGM